MQAGPGQTLSHYRLIDKIGEGGMGVVWKAEDVILGRVVAIKVLPTDVIRDETRRKMFLNEARLASSLSGAHIAQVHEFGREGDLDFIVMEYIDGKPLSRVLHGRQLPADKVASIGLQVAQALSKAHRKNLLHRDLKPSNILLSSEGEVKVVDFGLAALFTPSDLTLGSDLPTKPLPSPRALGLDAFQDMGPVGTLPYMSPEQIRGEKLDSRSDIFSLGVVLYEATTGRRPFNGATPSHLAREIVQARPTPVHEMVPTVPLELNRIIQKSLAPKPSERYQTLDDMAIDLRRLGQDLESGSSPSYDALLNRSATTKHQRMLVLSAIIISAAILGIVVWRGKLWNRTAHPTALRSILIRPFDVRGQNQSADYLGRGFAEAIAINLAQLQGLVVLPVPEGGEMTDASENRSTNKARDIGADSLVTGALTREGNLLHATLSLVDSAHNRIIWGIQRDVDQEALPSLAASLANEIAAELGFSTVRRYDDFYRMAAPALAASVNYLDAVGAIRADNSASALAATERLVGAFPDSPDAHVLRLKALCDAAWNLGPFAPERKAFEEEATLLLRLDPKNPWPDQFRAGFARVDGKPEESLKGYTHLLSRHDLTPALRAQVLRNRAVAYDLRGDHGAALGDLEEAIRLDPISDRNYAFYAGHLQRLGRFDEALIAARHAIALNPSSDQNVTTLGGLLYQMKRFQEAAPFLRQSCELNHDQWSCATLAMALYKSGHIEAARTMAKTASAMQETLHGVLALADCRALLGDRTAALDLLRRGIELGGLASRSDIEGIASDPDWSILRNDAEFRNLLAEAAKHLP